MRFRRLALAILLPALAAFGCDEDEQEELVLDPVVAGGFCREGQTTCGGRCVDTLANSRHCGQCNRVCATGLFCVGASCLPCAPPRRVCADECVDLANDEDHCGTCHRACGTGEVCFNGRCARLRCAVPFEAACEHRCVSVQSDRLNCGRCGNVCLGGNVCVEGRCGLASTICLFPLRICENQCIDSRSDNRHCGACFNACDLRAGETCQSGFCRCPLGWQKCAGLCTNIGVDPNNCGGCLGAGGIRCTSAEVCDAGQCLRRSLLR